MSRFVATSSGVATTSGTTCTATLPNTTGASAIVVAVAVNQSNSIARTVSSVTDTAGNTYTKATSIAAAPNIAGDPSVELWYKLTPATSAAVQTYTVTVSGAAPSIAMRVMTFGGTTTLDTTATLASSSVSPATIGLTTAASDELVVTAIAFGVDQTQTTISTVSPGDFPIVLAQNASVTGSTQLAVVFESRPGARLLNQVFTQSDTSVYVAAAMAVGCPLAAAPPGSSGISITSELVKDPNSALDYVFNWVNWLSGVETITSATVTADPGISVDWTSNGSNYVTAWLSGGTSGLSYTVTCSVTTSLGRTDDRSITISVQNK